MRAADHCSEGAPPHIPNGPAAAPAADGSPAPAAAPLLCPAAREILAAPARYHLRAASTAERDRWVRAVNRAVRAHRAERERRRGRPPLGRLRAAQLRLRGWYEGAPFRTASAALIGLNFCYTVRAVRSES